MKTVVCPLFSSMLKSDDRLIDAVGVCHAKCAEPARIVSLVPSITELLFELGLGEQVVGRTRYCVHPAGAVEAATDVGGTKKVKRRVLQNLRATHVIVNIDENPKAMVEHIAGYIPEVIVTHPLTPTDNIGLYRLLGGVFRRESAAESLCSRFQQALTSLREQSRGWPRRKVLYLIWRKPWMSVAPDTYISRTLNLLGWETLPREVAVRYPVVEISPALLEETDWVLFSTEPYRFLPDDLVAFARQYACSPDKLRLIDGGMTSWYGSRAILGLEYLARFAADRD